MKIALSLSAAVLLLLTGCRDYVVNPEPPVNAVPRPELPNVQLKGPETVQLGTAYTYKAGDQVNVRYDWAVQGPAGFAGEGDGTRFYRGVAQDTGAAVVRVFVLDATGEPIGFAERNVQIVTER